MYAEPLHAKYIYNCLYTAGVSRKPVEKSQDIQELAAGGAMAASCTDIY